MLCLGFTGYLAAQGEITVGEVVMYQTYFSSIVAQVSSIITLLPTIAKGLESVDSVGDILLSHDVEDNDRKKKSIFQVFISLIPALLALATASMDSGLGGSTIDTIPRKINPYSVSGLNTSSDSLYAKASTLSPF